MGILTDKRLTATIIRGVILFAGLIIAGFYGMQDQWPAALAGLLAAGLAFFSKGRGGK